MFRIQSYHKSYLTRITLYHNRFRVTFISCDTHHSVCQTTDMLQIHARYAARHRRRRYEQDTSRYGTHTEAHPIHTDTNPSPSGTIVLDTARYKPRYCKIQQDTARYGKIRQDTNQRRTRKDNWPFLAEEAANPTDYNAPLCITW